MTISADLRVRPSWRLILSHPAHFFSFGLGSGLSPVMPGTMGTLAAFPLYAWFSQAFTDTMFLVLLVWLFAFGVWACDKTGRTLGVADYGGIVWDEIVAFMLVLFFTPDGFFWSLLAFLLFRFFDIVKPPPIRHFDRTWHGGLGVMFDDILAAGYTLLCLAFVKSLLA